MRGGRFQSGDANDSEMLYDDSAFKIFAVAFLAVYWVPVALYRLTCYTLRRLHKQTPMEKAKQSWCVCLECQHKADRITEKTAGIKGFSTSDIIFIIVTILLMISSVSVFRSNLRTEAPFDPFVILDISKSATSKEIKKKWRKLSVIHHPDKNLNDRDNAAERFLKISKAYSALTDPVAKENFKKYGNPDGYIGTSWVLGLPEWVGSNSKSVLLMYAFFMVIIFPGMVGFWWHKSKQQLTSEIMTSTFMMYRETLMHTKRFRDLLTAFCGSDEFNSLYTTDNESYLNEVNESLRKIGGLPKWKSVSEPSRSQIQNVMIMTAYLARIPIPKQLNYVLEGILLRCEPLLTSLTDTVGVFQRPDCKSAWERTLMYGHTTFLARCLQLTQCVYQSLDEKSSPLLQIPHFTEREVKFCTTRGGTTKSVYDIMRMDINDLKKVLRDFSDAQLLDVKAFCDRFPVATLEIEPPIVEGEDDTSVHEGDNVTVRTTVRILRRSGSAFSPHVPRIPYRKEEVWWLWLADQERQCPIEVRRLLPKMARGHDGIKKKSGFDEEDEDEDDYNHGPILEDDYNTDSEDMEMIKKLREEKERKKRRKEEVERLAADPRVTVFEVAFKYIAPKAGSYTLEVRTACDCYAGASKAHLITMHVKEAVKIVEEQVRYSDDEEEEEEEEDEEEDEDDDEDNEMNGRENSGDGDGEEEDDDSEYEYIEVTASDSEAGDFDEEDDDEDDFGISGVPKGDPSAH